MAQRISTAEELAESIRLLEQSVEESWVGAWIDDAIKLAVHAKFANAKRQTRIVIAMQTMGIRLMRTSHVDKNLITELRAIEADGVEQEPQTGRLLQFAEAPATRRRKASGGSGPLDAA